MDRIDLVLALVLVVGLTHDALVEVVVSQLQQDTLIVITRGRRRLQMHLTRLVVWHTLTFQKLPFLLLLLGVFYLLGLRGVTTLTGLLGDSKSSVLAHDGIWSLLLGPNEVQLHRRCLPTVLLVTERTTFEHSLVLRRALLLVSWNFGFLFDGRDLVLFRLISRVYNAKDLLTNPLLQLTVLLSIRVIGVSLVSLLALSTRRVSVFRCYSSLLLLILLDLREQSLKCPRSAS